MAEARGPGADDRQFATVAKEAEVPEGSMLGIAVSGNPILLSKIGGRVYAMDAVCSHMSGYLPKGELREGVVTCPVHRVQFDIMSGEVVKNVGALMKMASHMEASRLRTYGGISTRTGSLRAWRDSQRARVTDLGGPENGRHHIC